MSARIRFPFLPLIIVVSLVLSACQTKTEVVKETVEVKVTEVVTQIVEKEAEPIVETSWPDQITPNTRISFKKDRFANSSPHRLLFSTSQEIRPKNIALTAVPGAKIRFVLELSQGLE